MCYDVSSATAQEKDPLSHLSTQFLLLLRRSSRILRSSSVYHGVHRCRASCEPCFTISSAKSSSNQLQGTVDMIRDVTSDVSLHLFPAHWVQAWHPLKLSWVPAFVVEPVLAIEVPPALATCHRGKPRAISKHWASSYGPEAEYWLELVPVPECMASNVCTRTNTQS